MADPEKGAPATAMEEEVDEDEVEEVEDEEGGADRKGLVDKLMKDPQVLAALQTKLRRYLGTPSGYISVRYRVEDFLNHKWLNRDDNIINLKWFIWFLNEK